MDLTCILGKTYSSVMTLQALIPNIFIDLKIRYDFLYHTHLILNEITESVPVRVVVAAAYRLHSFSVPLLSNILFMCIILQERWFVLSQQYFVSPASYKHILLL